MNQQNYNSKSSEKLPTDNSAFTSNTIILSKESSESEVKAYFNAVLALQQSSDEFPVNLDSVWQLVYGSKQKAVNELKNSKNEDGTPRYIENIDYQSLNQKVKAGHTYSVVHNYTLSVSCLEWFIARKVRMVFEVYRQVFHKVASGGLSRKDLALMVIQAEEEKERFALDNRQKDAKIAKLQPKADFADAAFKATDSMVDIGQAAKILNLGFGRNTLFKKLKEAGILFSSRNEPKQKYIDAGYFIMTELPPIHRDNHPDIIHMKVLCSQKGLAFINQLFGGQLLDKTITKIV